MVMASRLYVTFSKWQQAARIAGAVLIAYKCSGSLSRTARVMMREIDRYALINSFRLTHKMT